MSLIFANIRSGSEGNCSFVGTSKGGVLIDVGITRQNIIDELQALNIPPEIIKAIFITHEHTDHCKSVSAIANLLHIPVYSKQGTLMAMFNNKILKPNVKTEYVGEGCKIEDFEVIPFSLPHDAIDPVGYKIIHGNKSISICTDLGYVPDSVYDYLSGSDLILLESNYDEASLEYTTVYPAKTKARILSNTGHISNPTCAENILNLCKEGTRHFILGHLSRNTNTYELAYNTTNGLLQRNGAEDYTLICARHDKRTPVYIIE